MVASKVHRYGERHLHYRDMGGLQEGDQEAISSTPRTWMRLKHTDSICNYVKEFSSLMLKIPNMTEEKLLFNFMDNLQG